MARLRALFDTNLYLNFLLSPAPVGTAVDAALAACAAGQCELLLPEDVLVELAQTVAARPHLASRIDARDMQALLDRLMVFATRLPPLAEPPPSLSRDPHDDYLLALAATHAADVLVRRDRDLLDLGEILGVAILDPASFLARLRSESA